MKDRILGWDVGGANIKAACFESGVDRPSCIERPFALWREPGRLGEVLAEAAESLGGPAGEMALTMTAELADCFPTRRDGVWHVLDVFSRTFPDARVGVWGLDGRFRTLEEARAQPGRVASANWLATAMLVATMTPDAILLDVGSTTADVIPIAGGRVVAVGRTDTERLTTGELVYTGALRTPVSAIVRSVPVGGHDCRVAAEYFAVAADVHLWLGRIEESEYVCETPDGRAPGRAEAGARIARMVCSDIESLGPDDISDIANHVAAVQIRQIAAAVRQVLERFTAGAPDTAVVGGIGAFLARDAAGQTGMKIRDLAQDLGVAAARIGPAAAVAYLLRAAHEAPEAPED